MELELKSHENQISALSRIQFPSSLTPSMTSSLTSSLTPSLTSLPGSSNVRTHSSYTCNTRVVQTHTSGGVNTRTVTQTTHNNTNNNGDISSFTDSLTDNLTDNQTSDLDNSRLTDSRPQSYISVTSENSGTEAEIEGYDGDIETPAGKDIRGSLTLPRLCRLLVFEHKTMYNSGAVVSLLIAGALYDISFDIPII